MLIRDATEADLPAIQAIYAHHVLNGVGTFEETPPTVEDMAGRWAGVTGLGLPWLVAEDEARADGRPEGRLWGYAYATPFRTRSAYRYVAEDAIYVAHDAHRRGVGRALMQALIARCEALGLRQLMAVIGDSDNEGSVGLHAAMGFEPAGVFRDVGYKHRRWLDIVLMQKVLGGGGDVEPSGPGLPLA
jgi:L-amino acid N-acyltransferase YncA